MGVKCFWLEPSGKVRRYLRRYKSSEEDKCSVAAIGYHNAEVFIDELPVEHGERGVINNSQEWPDDDHRWPTHCPCGYVFTDRDAKHVRFEEVYTRSDNGAETTLHDAPPGAMWNARWMADIWHGDDGMCVVVRCPNGKEWTIDSQASNCTIPDDHNQQRHHCWVRKGQVPNITVGKDGPTCNAGAGSIQFDDYHGFLRNGEFEP